MRGVLVNMSSLVILADLKNDRGATEHSWIARATRRLGAMACGVNAPVGSAAIDGLSAKRRR
jgi:hypothetical protein